VVCEIRNEYLVERCMYNSSKGIKYVQRIRIVLDLEVREAKSGNVVGAKTFYSSTPAECPAVLYNSDNTAIYGEIDYTEINNWLQVYVIR
jgi:hypothetical protein